MRIRSVSVCTVVLSSLLLLAAVPASANSYDRSEWLPGWSDADGDCQDTRHELLIRYSLAPVTYTRADNCRVDTGLWLDPYTGSFYSEASDLDVEHIVPLKWAHERGGAHWSRERKRQFAEDPDNLWLVDDGRNQSKGHRGPDQWMPPYAPASRVYVQRFMAIVQKYGLRPSLVETSRFEALAAGS